MFNALKSLMAYYITEIHKLKKKNGLPQKILDSLSLGACLPPDFFFFFFFFPEKLSLGPT